MSPTDDHWSEWLPQIGRIAASVGRRTNASRTVRDELEGSAVTHVYERIAHFDPTRGAFSTWCQTILRNHCVSLIRGEASRINRGRRHAEDVAHKHEQRLAEAPPPTPLEVDEDRAAADRRPKIDVVATLERHLQPIDRVLLVVYAELCSTCGDATLGKWCIAAGGIDRAGLLTIEKLPKARRKQALATLCGESVGWVRQRIFRAARRLKERGVGEADA